MKQVLKFTEWVVRQPLLWGSFASLVFYTALSQRWIDSPMLVRYMNGHPVDTVEGILFFIGMAVLLFRLFGLVWQLSSLGERTLSPVPQGGQDVAECDRLLGELQALPEDHQQYYLVRRLREALELIRRKNSADSLEQHLHHLEELDAVRMQSGYAIIRIIVWAIPILGFLGTVIGITMAIASLSPEALEKSMLEVTAGLGVAFDTTAQALALTMILMFLKHAVERVEDRLLSKVDQRASEELVGRFHETVVDSDPNVAVIRRIAEQVIGAMEGLTMRQAKVWKTSIDETHKHWAEVSTAAGRIIKDTLDSSLKDSLQHHAEALNQGVQKHAVQINQGADKTVGRLGDGLERMAELLVEALHQHGDVLINGEKELARENRQHLSEVEAALGEAMVLAADRQEKLVNQSEKMLKDIQMSLVEAATTTIEQQEQLVRQGDVLLRVVDATGQVKKLEESLNQNLAALDRTQNFQKTVHSLSSAVELLCARLAQSKPGARAVEVTSGDHPAHHAA